LRPTAVQKVKDWTGIFITSFVLTQKKQKVKVLSCHLRVENQALFCWQRSELLFCCATRNCKGQAPLPQNYGVDFPLIRRFRKEPEYCFD
jgi:hypothetical protein